MAPHEIVPVARITRRIPQQGRIRMGEKRGNRPVALDKFRLTSPDQEAITEISLRYGGVPRVWEGAPRGVEWEVSVDASELPIALPPDPLGGSPVYELWSGGGCQRRCDGEQAEVPTSDGMMTTPCVCVAKGSLECKPIVRLNVILREIRFGGVWMLEAHGWNAFHELPGMVEAIAAMQSRGITRAALALEPRVAKRNGKTSRFVVPVVRLADSVEALVAGAATIGSLGSAAHVAPQLMSGQPIADDDDVMGPADEPILAEIVELEQPPAMYRPSAAESEEIRARCMVQASIHTLESGEWLLSKLRLASSKGTWRDAGSWPTEEQWQRLNQILTDIEDGVVVPEVVDGNKMKLRSTSSR